MLLLSLLACQDISLVEQKEYGLIIAPDIIEFGHLLSGHESASEEIHIANASSEEIVVDYLEISGDNFSVMIEGFTVEPGGWHQIDVGYTPVTFEHNEGAVDIYLQGEEGSISSVWLDGYGDAPVINLEPSEVDFGTPLLGCEFDEEINIENKGNVDLIINNIQFMTNIPQEIELDYGSLPAFPWIILPSSRLTIFLQYIPEDTSGDTFDWSVESNDPAQPIYEASAIGNAVLSNEVHQTWIQDSEVVIDIVWIIDNSGSMTGYQSLLGNNMGYFMNILLSYSPNYQMVFITTDNPSFVGGQIITPNSGDPILQSVSIINSIGITGSGQEKGLEMLRICMDIGDCSSMMRQGAFLIPIFLSDEPDHSHLSVNAFINFFDVKKPGKFIPFAIIGDIPNGCLSPVSGWPTQAGWGYWDIVNVYNSKWWSICDTDWGSQMEEVAQSIALRNSFELEETDPVVDSITVWINGQEIEEGWEYNEENNSIDFDYDSIPEPGDLIEVSYSYWGCTGE